jgi:hypothetical protein
VARRLPGSHERRAATRPERAFQNISVQGWNNFEMFLLEQIQTRRPFQEGQQIVGLFINRAIFAAS